MSDQNLSRKERNFSQHRAEILEAAEELFALKGYLATSMEEVAQRAEFAVGTLYNFFRNKDDLYSAILHQYLDPMGRRLREGLATAETPLGRITLYFRLRMDLFWENPRFFRLYFHHTMNPVFNPRPGFTDEFTSRYEELLERLTRVFKEGIQAGEFIPVEPRLLAIALEGMLRSYLVYIGRSPNLLRQPSDEDELWLLFVSGVIAPEQRSAGRSR